MAGVFKDSAIMPAGHSEDTPIVAALYVNGKLRDDFIFFGATKGSQHDRVQVEVAADGSIYTTMCDGSVGSCTVSLLDRKDSCNESKNPSFALKCYLQEMITLKQKQTEIRLYESNALVATFNGVTVGADVDVRYSDSGILLFITTLKLIGKWL